MRQRPGWTFVFVFGLLVTMVPAVAGAQGNPFPGGPALSGCQSALVTAAGSVGRQHAIRLQRCASSLLRCNQLRPDDPVCAERAAGECARVASARVAAESRMSTVADRMCSQVETSLFPNDGLAFMRSAATCEDPHGVRLTSARDVGTCLARRQACANEQGLGLLVPRAGELMRLVDGAASDASCVPDYGGDGAHVDDERRVGRPLERCFAATLREGRRVLEDRSRAAAVCAASVLDCLAIEGGSLACLESAASACTRRLARLGFSGATLSNACRESVVPFATLAAAEGGGLAALTAPCAAVGVPSLASADDWLMCVDRRIACLAADVATAEVPRADELFGRLGIALRPPYCSASGAPTPTVTPLPTETSTSTPLPTATEVPTLSPPATRTTTPTPIATGTSTATTTAVVSRTPTAVPTATRTATAAATPTVTATPTRTATRTPTATRSSTPAATATRTVTPTSTPPPGPTATPNNGNCDASSGPYGLNGRAATPQCRLDGDPDQLSGMQVERVFSSVTLASPLQLTHAPDGTDRVFVVEQGGRIRVFANATSPSATDFLTVSGVVVGGEEGLLGLAFHPQYASNGFFYVYYSTGGPRRSIIARYRVSANPNVADAASGQVLMEIPQPYSNHNGGQLAFGPDGMLYVSLGDGGSGGDPGNRAQNKAELLGKILRIDVDRTSPGLGYAIPSDNPFVGQSDARGEIWALGLRNPWRMSFDRLTHALWAGDVGEGTWEEVNLIERGGNYGWRRMEGNGCFNPSSGCDDGTLIRPLAAYSHSEGGCAVTGGIVYRGSRLPELYGAYVYGDYCSGNVWALRYDGTTATVARIVANSGLSISSFGEDRDGELYIVNRNGNGSIHRLQRTSGGQAGTFPRTLSATGCFSDVPNRVAATGLVPYDVRSPLWSDRAAKRRFLMVPTDGTIGFQTNGAWSFPVGSILVKEFSLELERGNPASTHALETRFLVRRTDGWKGYTYQWNDEQTEAFLLDNGTTETFTVTDPQDPGHPEEHTHVYPSRSQCVQCHTTAAGGTLGLQTAQLNRNFAYGNVVDNELRALEHAGFFGGCLPARPASLPELADPSDPVQPLAARARSYLHANCAQCHLPGGTAPTAFDLRAETPFASTGLCNAMPQHGDLGVAGARIVSPGHPEDSVLWLRAAMRGNDQMPPLGTLIPDPLGSNLLEAWIDGLSGCQ